MKIAPLEPGLYSVIILLSRILKVMKITYKSIVYVQQLILNFIILTGLDFEYNWLITCQREIFSLKPLEIWKMCPKPI